MPEISPATTERVLDLIHESALAHEAGDEDRFRTLIDQALEISPEAMVIIRGGIMIGEIPPPDSEDWWPWYSWQKVHLAGMQAEGTGDPR